MSVKCFENFSADDFDTILIDANHVLSFELYFLYHDKYQQIKSNIKACFAAIPAIAFKQKQNSHQSLPKTQKVRTHVISKQ